MHDLSYLGEGGVDGEGRLCELRVEGGGAGDVPVEPGRRVGRRCHGNTARGFLNLASHKKLLVRDGPDLFFGRISGPAPTSIGTYLSS